MSRTVETYEVRVNVKRNGAKHYSTHVGKYISDEITEMFHIDARTAKQAICKAEKYGRPIGARKADVDRMRGNPENFKLEQETPNYSYAIMLDEMVWLKRNKRIGSQKKDKEKP